MIVDANAKFINKKYTWMNLMLMNEVNFNLFYANSLINVNLYYDLSYIQNTNQENVNFHDLYHTRNFDKNKFSRVEFGFESVFNLMKLKMKFTHNSVEHPQTFYWCLINAFDNLTMFEGDPIDADVITAYLDFRERTLHWFKKEIRRINSILFI